MPINILTFSSRGKQQMANRGEFKWIDANANAENKQMIDINYRKWLPRLTMKII